MENMQNNKDEILQLLEKIKQLAENDSLYLTRDDQDSVFYRVQDLKTRITEIYGRK